MDQGGACQTRTNLQRSNIPEQEPEQERKREQEYRQAQNDITFRRWTRTLHRRYHWWSFARGAYADHAPAPKFEQALDNDISGRGTPFRRTVRRVQGLERGDIGHYGRVCRSVGCFCWDKCMRVKWERGKRLNVYGDDLLYRMYCYVGLVSWTWFIGRPDRNFHG